MKVMQFSLYMLVKEKKKSFFYVLSCTLSVMFTFLFLNIIYNENYYGGKQMATFGQYNNILSIMLPFLAIAIVVAMNFYTYHFYLTSQTKEIGIFLLSGSKMSRLFLYLFTQNIVIFLIAMILGIGLGFGIIPLVNMFIGYQINEVVPLFVYHPVALFGTIGITICVLFYLAYVSVGFIHRHEIKEIIGMKNEIDKKDQRILYLPPLLYLLIFLSPIPAAIIFQDPQITAVYSFVAILGGFKGFCRYVLPSFIKKLQRHVLLEHRLGLIVSGNFNQILISSCGNNQIFLMICIFMNAYMITHVANPMNVALVFVAYVALVICICMGMLYKILLEITQRKMTFKHLHQLGYTKKEITKIIFYEVLTLFGMTAFILVIYIGAIYLPYLMNGTLKIGFVIQNMSIFILAIFLTGIISYYTYKRAMMEEME